MKDLDFLFSRLAESPFRRRFRLAKEDRVYLEQKTLPTILAHAREFVAKRLAPAEPKNDGRQTPMRGHPVFIAQHATATCCRSCLAKWHDIPPGRALTGAQQRYVVAVIEIWLQSQLR